jgi:hypothetical protein
MPVPFLAAPLALMPAHIVTVTFDPVALARQEVIVGGEVALGDDRSVAVRGRIPSRIDGMLPWRDGGWQASVQMRQYVVGDFDTGVAVAAEGGWTRPPRGAKDSVGHGSVGAYLGAKATFALFSIEARGGAALVGPMHDVAIEPRAQFGVGVSF